MKKIFLISGSILLLLLLIALAGIYFYITPERVANMANRQLDEKLEVSIGSASFNPFSRTLHLGEVTLLAVQENEDLVLFQAENLTVESIGLFRAMQGELSVGSLSADQFLLDLTHLPSPAATNYSGRTSAPVHLGGLDLKSGELRFAAGIDGTGVIHGLQLSAGSISYQPDAETELRSLISDLELTSERFEYRFQEETYQLSAETISISEGDSTFEIGQIRLESLNSDQSYFDALEFRKDLIVFDVAGISATGLDLPSYLQSGDIVAGSVRIDNAELHVTSDKRIPNNPDKEPKPFPHQVLQNLPFTVSLDTIQLRDGDIRYSEYDEEGIRPGTIHFADMGVVLLGVKNREMGTIQLTMHSNLQGTGRLETDIRLYSDNASDIIAVTGSLDEFDLTRLNTILMDLEGIEINGGTIRDLHFDYRMTSSGSMGTIRAQYDGFSMQSISREDHSQNLGDHLSGIVHTVAIRSSSGSDGEEIREGSISVDRDPEKSIFNYLWVSLRSGLMDIVNRLN